jgi:hypothetical protein
MESGDERVLKDIETCGWHVVLAPEDGEGPGFAYTVGLFETFQHPEVIIFGLPLKIMHRTLNCVGELVRGGLTLTPGGASSEVIENYEVRFETVAKRHFRLFGYAMWFYEVDDFPTLQSLWPGASGDFPGDSDAPEWLTRAQPLLQL